MRPLFPLSPTFLPSLGKSPKNGWLYPALIVCPIQPESFPMSSNFKITQLLIREVFIFTETYTPWSCMRSCCWLLRFSVACGTLVSFLPLAKLFDPPHYNLLPPLLISSLPRRQVLSGWLTRPPSGSLHEPQSARRHHPTPSLFLPSFLPFLV